MKKMKNDFNKNHPERLSDEVFITNADDEINFPEGKSSFQVIGWKTKRRGNVAYDINGKPLGSRWPESFPVFVKQKEIRAEKDGDKILEGLLPSQYEPGYQRMVNTMKRLNKSVAEE